MRRSSVIFLALAMFALGCTGAREKKPRHEVRVAAAADLKFALDDLLAEFRRARPDIAVETIYGSSGNFFAQIQNGAPFDLFLSADTEYPRQLVAKGLAPPKSEFVYAVGHIVVWARRDSGPDVEKLGARALLEPSVRKVAIADPRYAPYGRAAEAALKALGLYDKVKGRLVLGDNVAQTAQFVEKGAAEVGVIGLAQALAPALREQGRFWKVPADAYPRMDQAGVVLSRVRDRAAAEAVRDYVLSEHGREVLKRYGFSTPGG
jgi:molybdate transport system substrate-binding protein